MDAAKWDTSAPKNAAERNVTRVERHSERRVVWNLLNSLIAEGGFVIDAVDDGEEHISVGNDPVKALDAVFAVDESHIIVKDGAKAYYILIVLGNSAEEVICDYSYISGGKFERFMDEFDPVKWLR